MVPPVFSRKQHGRFLLGSGTKPRTHDDYITAVKVFVEWCTRTHLPFEQIQTAEQLDDLLTDYIHDIYELRAGGGRQKAVNTIYGLRMLLPRLKYQLLTSQRAVDQWKRLVPPESYPPLTWELTAVMAFQMARHGCYRFAVAMLLSFDCLLRVSEMAALKRDDIIDVGDDRFGAVHRRTTVHIRSAKTGDYQSVDVNDPSVIALLRGVLQDTAVGGALFPGGVPKYRRMFNKIRDELGLSRRYGTHSLRHGGATNLYLRKVPIEDILVRGRWESHKSVRRYIKAAKGLLASMQAPDNVNLAGRVMSRDIISSLSYANAVALT